MKKKDWELTLLTKNNQKNDLLIGEILLLLDTLLDKNASLNGDSNGELINKIKRLKHGINNNSWAQFENHFKNVHPNFSENLMNTFPKLTSDELKLCFFLRLNMNSKEIASITNKENASIDIARYRLRKKLELNKDEKLHEILMRY